MFPIAITLPNYFPIKKKKPRRRNTLPNAATAPPFSIGTAAIGARLCAHSLFWIHQVQDSTPHGFNSQHAVCVFQVAGVCGASGHSAAATAEAEYKHGPAAASPPLRSRTCVKGWWRRGGPATRSPAGVRSSSHPPRGPFLIPPHPFPARALHSLWFSFGLCINVIAATNYTLPFILFMCVRVCAGVRARVCYLHSLQVSALTQGVHVGTGTLIDEKYQ